MMPRRPGRGLVMWGRRAGKKHTRNWRGRRRHNPRCADRRYQQLERAFEDNLVNQGRQEARSLAETLRLAWQVHAVLPRKELAMLPAEALDKYHPQP